MSKAGLGVAFLLRVLEIRLRTEGNGTHPALQTYSFEVEAPSSHNCTYQLPIHEAWLLDSVALCCLYGSQAGTAPGLPLVTCLPYKTSYIKQLILNGGSCKFVHTQTRTVQFHYYDHDDYYRHNVALPRLLRLLFVFFVVVVVAAAAAAAVLFCHDVRMTAMVLGATVTLTTRRRRGTTTATAFVLMNVGLTATLLLLPISRGLKGLGSPSTPTPQPKARTSFSYHKLNIPST